MNSVCAAAKGHAAGSQWDILILQSDDVPVKKMCDWCAVVLSWRRKWRGACIN